MCLIWVGAEICRKVALQEQGWRPLFSGINLQLGKDASIRYSGSVSAPIRSFSVDQVTVRRDRSKSVAVCILFRVVVKPHESHKNIIKHHKSLCALYFKCSEVEIDRYIGLPIFFPIFKHFTIIGYRFCKKNISVLMFFIIIIFFFFFFFIHTYIHTYIIIQSITSSEILTYIRPIQVHTHLEQCSLRKCSSTTTHVTLYKIDLFETCWIILTFTIEPLFRQ